MKTLFSLYTQDTILSWRNGLILVTLITLAVMVVLYWVLPLLLPEDVSFSSAQVFLDETDGTVVERFLLESGADPEIFLETEEGLEAFVAERSGRIGIKVTGNSSELHYSFVFHDRPGERTVKILQAVLASVTASITGEEYGAPFSVETLRSPSDPPAANETMVAVMLAFEVMILGFLFVAVVVFGEKQEGSVRAYRVTPAGLTTYVVSKTLVFTLMSTVYGLLLVLFTFGIGVDYGSLLAILFPACALMTLLGLGIAAFFRNISEWFVPGVLILGINMLSIIPYQMPTYSAKFLTYLPGYIVIFGISEVLLPTGKTGFLVPILITLGLQLAVTVVFTLWSVRRNIMKEH